MGLFNQSGQFKIRISNLVGVNVVARVRWGISLTLTLTPHLNFTTPETSRVTSTISSITDAMTAAPTIAALFVVCTRSFANMFDCLVDSDGEFSSQISISAIQDELGRFRVWAGNVGAHRTGRVSLDHKLRESPQVHGMVTALMKDLDDSLRECKYQTIAGVSQETKSCSAIAIISHERTPCDELNSPDSSVSSLDDEDAEELDPTTELQERFVETCHVITCLYRFTITMRSPAQRDRLQKCASIDVSHYEFFDIGHASNKFPGVEQFLIDRLGKANTRRRQLLLYHRKHHTTISQYLDLVPVNPGLAAQGMPGVAGLREIYETESPLNDQLIASPGTGATTVHTQTTISTFVQGPSGLIYTGSDSGHTQTSYATSAADDTHTLLSVPSPPNPERTLDGEPFECPYCFRIVAVDSIRAWT